MIRTAAGARIRRRWFLQSAAAIAAGGGLSSPVLGQLCPVKEGTVRDRLWVFCNPVNADYDVVRRRTVMSPFESAVYMGVPNIIMVNSYPPRQDGAALQPDDERFFRAWVPPFELYAYPLKLLKRVTWSIVDDSGVTLDWEREQVLAMARKTPNFVGLFMDDFFRFPKKPEPNPKLASLTVDELRAVQQELKRPGKKLDLYVTLYNEGLDHPIGEYLELIDVITFWNHGTAALANLDQNLTRLAKLASKSRIMLGCYTAEADDHRTPRWLPMPVETMKYQCELGLKFLHEGRIKGIIIYGNFLDFGWESHEWARQWIQKVGDTKL
jgi:hypothetical protein